MAPIRGFPVLVGWLSVWLYVLIGILLAGLNDFNYGLVLLPWMLLLNIYIFPWGQLILLGLVFAIGTYIGRLLRFLFPNLAGVRVNQVLAAFFVATLFLSIVWVSVRNGQPDYTNYTEAQCANLHSSFFSSKYLHQGICFHEVASATKNPAVCDNLDIESVHYPDGSENSTRGWCLEQVAEHSNNPEICAKITDSMKDRCYGYFHMCEDIAAQGWREVCESSRAYLQSQPREY